MAHSVQASLSLARKQYIENGDAMGVLSSAAPVDTTVPSPPHKIRHIHVGVCAHSIRKRMPKDERWGKEQELKNLLVVVEGVHE
jgi:hypothetical protein